MKREDGPLLQRWGMPVRQWSPTHSRFAIELLTDCRRVLMSIVRELDRHVENEEIDRDRLARDSGLKPMCANDIGHVEALRACVDRPSLLAAALYSQWCADHVANECVQLDKDLSAFVSRFMDGDDALALIEHPDSSRGFACGIVPDSEPPPVPEVLVEAGSLLAGPRTRLDHVRGMLTEAEAALQHTTTATTQVVREHISMLIGWCEPAATPRLEPEAFEDTAVGLLSALRQELLAIGCSLDDGVADRDRLMAGAAYTQWIIDELHSGPGSRPCPGEPATLDGSHDGLAEVERLGHLAVDAYVPDQRNGPIVTLMDWVMNARKRDKEDRW